MPESRGEKNGIYIKYAAHRRIAWILWDWRGCRGGGGGSGDRRKAGSAPHLGRHRRPLVMAGKFPFQN